MEDTVLGRGTECPQAGDVRLRCPRWTAACRTAECKTRTLHSRPRPASLSWHSSQAEPAASYSQLGIYYFSNAGAESKPESTVSVSKSQNLPHFSLSHINYISDLLPTNELTVKWENCRSARGREWWERTGEQGQQRQKAEDVFFFFLIQSWQDGRAWGQVYHQLKTVFCISRQGGDKPV